MQLHRAHISMAYSSVCVFLRVSVYVTLRATVSDPMRLSQPRSPFSSSFSSSSSSSSSFSFSSSSTTYSSSPCSCSCSSYFFLLLLVSSSSSSPFPLPPPLLLLLHLPLLLLPTSTSSSFCSSSSSSSFSSSSYFVMTFSIEANCLVVVLPIALHWLDNVTVEPCLTCLPSTETRSSVLSKLSCNTHHHFTLH